jgi:hypothetical protein
MIRILCTLLLLVPSIAWGQSAPQGRDAAAPSAGPVGLPRPPSPVSGVATSGARASDVMSWGATGDGETPDLAALLAAPSPAELPRGIFYTGRPITTLNGSFFGGISGGRLKSLEGTTQRLGPRNLSVLSAEPAHNIGFSENSAATAFDADFSRSFFTGLYRIVGKDTLGRPTKGYFGNIPASAIYLNYANVSAGHNQSNDSDAGRTGASAVRVRISNSGQGDIGAYNTNPRGF